MESSEAINIEFVARIRIDNPFRCAVTDPQLLRLMESLSCSQNRTSTHLFSVSSTSLHHTKDACFSQSKSKNCLSSLEMKRSLISTVIISGNLLVLFRITWSSLGISKSDNAIFKPLHSRDFKAGYYQLGCFRDNFKKTSGNFGPSLLPRFFN